MFEIEEDRFLLSINEELIDKLFLEKLKTIFIKYPGDNPINLKITSGFNSFRIIELKNIKVKICIDLYLDLLYII